MADAQVLRIFVQHWATEVPISTFIALKSTCRTVADACRMMEPRCHWDRFWQHMADYAPEFERYCKDMLMEEEACYVTYNDNVPFSDVIVYTALDIPQSAYPVGLFKKHVIIKKLEKVKYTRTILSKKRLMYDGEICTRADCLDSDKITDDELNCTIDEIKKYSEYIDKIYIGVRDRHMKPPYYALKSVIYYLNENDTSVHEYDLRPFYEFP